MPRPARWPTGWRKSRASSWSRRPSSTNSRSSLPKPAAAVVDALAEQGILAGVPASRLMPHEPAVRDLLIVAATETNTDEDCDAFAKALAEVLS